jgi:hypothetical protein
MSTFNAEDPHTGVMEEWLRHVPRGAWESALREIGRLRRALAQALAERDDALASYRASQGELSQMTEVATSHALELEQALAELGDLRSREETE